MIANPWKQKLFAEALWIKNPWGLTVEEQTANNTQLDIEFEGDTATISYDFSEIEYNRATVKAFPQFTFGWKDKNLTFPDDYTPITLNNGLNVMQFIAQNYLLSFTTQSKINPNAQCNIASEIFLYPGALDGPVVGQDPPAHEYEIMLWVDSPKDDMISLGQLVREDTNIGYKVYAKPGNKRYMAIVMSADFVNTREPTEVYIQWSKALSLAVAIANNTSDFFDPIASTWKAFGIETGAEIWAGKGQVYFKDIKLGQVRTFDNSFITDTKPAEQPIPTGEDGPVLPNDTSIESPKHRCDAIQKVFNAYTSIDGQCALSMAGACEEKDLLTVDMPEHTILLTEKLRLLTSLAQLIELERRRISEIVGYVASQQMQAEGNQNG